MALPKQIQRQLDAAEAFFEQNVEAPQQNAESQTDPQPEPIQAAPVAPALTAPASVPPPPPTPPADEPSWEHRYKTLQGMFAKQGQDMKQLSAKVEELTRAQQAKPSEPPPKYEPDAKDVEVFGPDLVSMVQRVGEQLLGGVVRTLDERLATLENSLKGTAHAVALTAEDTFFAKLAQAVPEWEALNQNQACLDWLAAEDPVFGVPRQNALDLASRSLNAQAAINIFKQLKSLVAPAPAATPAPAPATSKLDKQVSPNTAATSSAPAQPDVTIVTQKQITAFYDALAKRKYVGREEEAVAVEAQINRALAEGRVR